MQPPIGTCGSIGLVAQVWFSLLFSTLLLCQVGPALQDHREAVLAGIRDLVASLEAETDEWFANAPEHVRAALHPLGHPRFQVLAFVHLLEQCG